MPSRPSNIEALRLAAWLREWRTQCEFMQSEALPALPQEGAIPPVSPEVRPYDSPDFVAGDVRLLDPWQVRDATRPLLFAVLREWDEGMWLIAPFGPLSEPATVGEWKVAWNPKEKRGPELAVLCLWNAHTVPYEVLRQSWFVDFLDDQQRRSAWQVFQHVATGKPISSESLRSQIGVAMYHPADPRHDYLDQEMAIMEPLAVAAEEYVENLSDENALAARPAPVRQGADYRLRLNDESHLALAAGSSSTAPWKQFDLESGLRLSLKIDGPNILFLVRSRADNQPSPALDGGTLVVSGKAVARFYQKRALVAYSELVGEIAVRDAQGNPVALQPVEG